MFQLQDRLKRQRQRHIELKLDAELARIEGGHCEGYGEVNGDEDVDGDDEVEVTLASEGADGGGVKAVFGRLRTNKEVVAETSCGVMIGRGTFYGSEAPAGVIVSTSPHGRLRFESFSNFS